MFGKRRISYHAGERVLIRTRPRFIMHTKSVIIKVILALLIIYFFGYIVTVANNVQSDLINYVQVPLVQGTVLALFLIIFILLLWALWDLLSWKYIEYLITNQRVITKKGIISKKRAYVYHDKIEDITIYQSFFERISSSGDIEIFSGHENTHIVLENVPHPEKIEAKINQIMEGDFPNSRRARKPQQDYSYKENRNQKLTFSDPEYWETRDNHDEIRQEPAEIEKPVEKEKHITERHSEKFKRR